MLNPDLFLAYVAAVTLLLLMPGPIVTLVIANSLGHGARTGLLTAVSAGLGNALLVAGGALGLTALLALASDVFEWVRWAGVAYLVWLGLREWQRVFRPLADGGTLPPPKRRHIFAQGILVAITNPKTILFYAAFFPQFLDTALPAGPQLLIMSVTLVVLGICLDSMYAVLAGRLRGWLTNPRRIRMRHGITGTLLMGTGIGLALARR